MQWLTAWLSGLAAGFPSSTCNSTSQTLQSPSSSIQTRMTWIILVYVWHIGWRELLATQSPVLVQGTLLTELVKENSISHKGVTGFHCCVVTFPSFKASRNYGETCVAVKVKLKGGSRRSLRRVPGIVCDRQREVSNNPLTTMCFYHGQGLHTWSIWSWAVRLLNWHLDTQM